MTNALNQITSYTYDELGSLLTQTDANNRITRFEYDRMGRRTRRTLPMGGVETFEYDAGGNMTARVDFRGKRTTFTYNAMSRLLTKTPDPSLSEPTVTYTYTPLGQRASMNDASGTTTYTDDVRNPFTRQTARKNHSVHLR